MRTGTLSAAAVLMVAVFSGCGGGGGAAPSAPAATPTPASVAAPAFTTFAIPVTNGLRMAPISQDQMDVAVASDGSVGFAGPFANGRVANGTFSGSLQGNGIGGGPVTYGRGANGALFSGNITAGEQSPPFVRQEPNGLTWTLVPPGCGTGCDPILDAWPTTILAGADGGTWALTRNGFVRLNPDGTTTAGTPIRGATSFFPDAVLGPDGAFWVVDAGTESIVRVPLSGAPAVFPVGGRITRIAAGGDGALWFLDLTGGVRRITTAGAVSTVLAAPTGGLSAGDAIALGGDGAIWFTEANAGKLGRLAPNGAFNEFAAPTDGVTPTGLTAAPDGSLYFLEQAHGLVVVHAQLSQTGSVSVSR